MIGIIVAEEKELNAVKDIENPKIAVWGLAFKNGTDDVRESPAMQIVEQLLKNNVKLCVYDPKAVDNAKKTLGEKVEYASSKEDAVKGANVLAVLTEWEEFGEADLAELKKMMKTPKIVDLRNMLKAKNPMNEGVEYNCIGAN